MNLTNPPRFRPTSIDALLLEQPDHDARVRLLVALFQECSLNQRDYVLHYSEWLYFMDYYGANYFINHPDKYLKGLSPTRPKTLSNA